MQLDLRVSAGPAGARRRAADPDPDRAAPPPVHRPRRPSRLTDLFGEPARWGETLNPLQLATVASLVPGFTGSTTVQLAVPLTYDLDVAAAKYLHGLDDGEVPLLLLFSGTVFSGSPGRCRSGWCRGTRRRPSGCRWRCGGRPWTRTSPDAGWVRLRRETLEALRAYRSERVLPTWDDTVERLLKEAPVTAPLRPRRPRVAALDEVAAVADAVLFEGYLLYPYRASAQKNRLRWQFGVLTPPGFARRARPLAHRGAARTPGRRRRCTCGCGSCSCGPAPCTTPTAGPSTSWSSGGERHVPWDEGVPREVDAVLAVDEPGEQHRLLRPARGAHHRAGRRRPRRAPLLAAAPAGSSSPPSRCPGPTTCCGCASTSSTTPPAPTARPRRRRCARP